MGGWYGPRWLARASPGARGTLGSSPSDVGRAGIARARQRGHLNKFGGRGGGGWWWCGGVRETKCNLAAAGAPVGPGPAPAGARPDLGRSRTWGSPAPIRHRPHGPRKKDFFARNVVTVAQDCDCEPTVAITHSGPIIHQYTPSPSEDVQGDGASPSPASTALSRRARRGAAPLHARLPLIHGCTRMVATRPPRQPPLPLIGATPCMARRSPRSDDLLR